MTSVCVGALIFANSDMDDDTAYAVTKALVEQIEAFKEMLFAAPPDEDQRKDIDFLLAGGEIFALVVYGQLFLENAEIYGIEPDLIDQVFDVFVRDFSRFATQLHGKASTSKEQAEYCIRMIRRPAEDDASVAERFLNEAQTLAGLHHPHIVTLFDFGQTDAGEL